MTRKLASIQVIREIHPIEGADAIEVATVLGWKCVVAKKDGFKPGDLAVYIEIDSVLPDQPVFEFMRARKFRVRTIKLRGQISQGLVLPTSILPAEIEYHEGDDITAIIGVKKYDPQAEAEAKLAQEMVDKSKNKITKFLSRYGWFRRVFGKQKASFPSFIKKTDEDRIQLFPHYFDTEWETVFEVTEKLDGQSATYFLVRKKRIFGDKQIPIWGMLS